MSESSSLDPPPGSGDAAAPDGTDVRIVGHYEVSAEIGRGRAAIVYLARQVDLDRRVALKELIVAHSTPPDFAQRFLREARLAGSLSDPNIVTVYEYFERDGVPYIVMEYVPRGSLRPYVGSLSTAELAGVLEGVLAGLMCAETAGIVHRDVKPENIMVTVDGRVKLADFGIAKATQETGAERFVTAPGMTIGTPSYMAPEQALGEEVGPWTDLYAVGVLAWEQLIGHVPFNDTLSSTAVLLRHVNEEIPRAIDVRPDVDPDLSRWVGRLVANDPRERMRTASEAWDALEAIVVARLGPMWRRDSRLRQREVPPAREDGVRAQPHEAATEPLGDDPPSEPGYRTYLGHRPSSPGREQPEPEPRPAPPLPPPVREVHAALSTPTLSVRMGETGESTIVVTNLGTVADDYRVSVTGSAARFSALEVAALHLEPREQGEVQLRFSPSPDEGRPGPAPFELEVTSANDAGVSQRVAGTVVLEARAKPRVAAPPPAAPARRGREPFGRRLRVALRSRRWVVVLLVALLALVVAVVEPVVFPGGTVITAPSAINLDNERADLGRTISAGTQVRVVCTFADPSSKINGWYRLWRPWWHFWGDYLYYPNTAAPSLSLPNC
jgi:serine/threonine protein kinase